MSAETMSAVKYGAIIGLGIAVISSAIYLFGVVTVTRNVS